MDLRVPILEGDKVTLSLPCRATERMVVSEITLSLFYTLTDNCTLSQMVGNNMDDIITFLNTIIYSFIVQMKILYNAWT